MLRRRLELAQYASDDYQRTLAQHGIVCSMSRRGDCWDNAVAESFLTTLKVELVHNAAWATRAAARAELFEYLELHRPAAAFGARVSQPAGLRAPLRSPSIGSLTQVSTKPGQVHSGSGSVSVWQMGHSRA